LTTAASPGRSLLPGLNRQQIELLDGQLSRRPLLCNAAARGTGKSVQLAFNMAWFKQHWGGLPIEVTFNDDQGLDMFGLPPKGESFEDDFEAQVALRVIDRAMQRTWVCELHLIARRVFLPAGERFRCRVHALR
jgi:hypothetical protein